MKKWGIIVLAILIAASLSACEQSEKKNAGDSSADNVIIVAVGVVPEAAFVEAVAGDLVSVVTMIPPGYSPANFSPTAAQMQSLSDAGIYFTLQMPAEQANILPKAKDFNSDLEIIDLREAAAKQYPLLSADEHEAQENGSAVDPHLWLSPKRAIVMVQTIADELSKIDSANEEIYKANAAGYIAQIKALDAEIAQKLSGLEQKAFLIYHGSYRYFADDYDLDMIAIEIGGKQATAAELQDVISYALENGIKTVFYQDEFDDNQAQTVAKEIGGTVAKVSPLSSDYLQGLRDFTDALLAQGGQ
jgi:zinc transport system substrate-binding protein